MIKITIHNSVWTEVNKKGVDALYKHLCFNQVQWGKGMYGKQTREVYKKFLIEKHKDGYYFPTGLMDRVCNILDKNRFRYKVRSDIKAVEFDPPKVKGITFRKDQKRILEAALDRGRGVLKSPTGSGKTIITLGLMSSFNQENILFLVHTQDLVLQTAEKIKEHDILDVGIYYANEKEINRITVATIQSFSKLNMKDHVDKWDVVIVDETHHVSKFNGQYAKVLTSLAAPVKLGLTATEPDDEKEENKWAMESLIGPIIGEVTLKEGQDIGFLAKPRVEILDLPMDWNISECKNYAEAYSKGIVHNYIRNLIIARKAKEEVNNGRSVLISIDKIAHGENIEECCKEIGLNIVFVHGKSDREARKEVIDGLNDGTIKCAIASDIFKEGVNIPGLQCCILASGGKSASRTLQIIGRGLRVTSKKKTVLIVDFKDITNKYLRTHFYKRMKIYVENDWLNKKIANKYKNSFRNRRK